MASDVLFRVSVALPGEYKYDNGYAALRAWWGNVYDVVQLIVSIPSA